MVKAGKGPVLTRIGDRVFVSPENGSRSVRSARRPAPPKPFRQRRLTNNRDPENGINCLRTQPRGGPRMEKPRCRMAPPPPSPNPTPFELPAPVLEGAGKNGTLFKLLERFDPSTSYAQTRRGT